jgi:hypothetical protein
MPLGGLAPSGLGILSYLNFPFLHYVNVVPLHCAAGHCVVSFLRSIEPLLTFYDVRWLVDDLKAVLFARNWPPKFTRSRGLSSECLS